MDAKPYIPSGPLPSFRDFARDDEAEVRGAYASRVLVPASRRNELSEESSLSQTSGDEAALACSAGAEVLPDLDAEKSSSRRDAPTNTRDAYGTQNFDSAPTC